MDAPHFLTPLVQVIGGLLLLLLGQRIFWLFVAAVGFFIGAQFGSAFFGGLGDFALLLAALGGGVVGAVLAIFLQRLAVIVAGAFAGGMLAIRVAPLLGLYTEPGMLTAFVVGALLAALVLGVLFNPALIVISALTGAVMVAEAMPIDPVLMPLVLIVLVVVGIVVQARRRAPRVV